MAAEKVKFNLLRSVNLILLNSVVGRLGDICIVARIYMNLAFIHTANEKMSELCLGTLSASSKHRVCIHSKIQDAARTRTAFRNLQRHPRPRCAAEGV